MTIYTFHYKQIFNYRDSLESLHILQGCFFFSDQHHGIFQTGSFCDQFRKQNRFLHQPLTTVPVELNECVKPLHCLKD